MRPTNHMGLGMRPTNHMGLGMRPTNHTGLGMRPTDHWSVCVQHRACSRRDFQLPGTCHHSAQEISEVNKKVGMI